ncbi:variant erythrocyte surface antigen-1, beta subunit, partial [Babesia divergens]
MVCYMYYTDVFVGTDNIDNLKSALKAELGGFKDDSNALTQLVQGLCLFMGYPSCVCSLKANVDKSLQDISKKLIQDSKAVKSCLSSQLDLNCSCNSNDILCKCCVISCIKELPKQCKCVKNASTECKCQEPKGKCCKDFLSGLEACLSLLNLKTDMQDCKCNGKTCCKNGTCTKSCTVCPNSKTLKTPKDYTVTGLGLLRPSPIRLAERLNDFFGDSGRKGSSGCTCKCGTSGSPIKSCCCLACQDCSSQNCFCLPGSQCSCASKLQLPKTSQCPRKTFCLAIQNVKVPSDSSEMKCCESGKKCHCHLPPGSSSSSGQTCCVEQLTGSNGQNSHQSLKCLLRRLVKFFKDFESSQPNCSKLCCDLLCVLKMCESFRAFYDKRTATVCNTCKKGGARGGCDGKCCKGSNPKCPSGSSPCKDCSECRQICDSKKFYRELQKLQYSGPCGLDLYRLLKDLLNFCSNVMHPNQDFIRSTVLEAVNSCNNCKKSGTDSSGWSACDCSKSGSSCSACPKLLKDSKLMSILRHGYVSSYTYKFLSSFDTHINATSASWKYLCASGSKCCSNPSCSKCQDCSSSGSPCPDPSQCCPDCPQRKAAKIFLGMLPCLYYGLKILHARSKYGSGFAGWHDISVNSKGLPSSDLGRFLYAWGYDLRPLKTKKGSEFFPLLDSFSTLKVLESLSTLVTEKYFTSFSSRSPSQPNPPS